MDADLTELVDIDPTRVDLVKNPANGFPILVMKAQAHKPGCGCCDDCGMDSDAAKAVNAQGGIDEKPDIDGAEHVMQLLARLIQAEAAELAIGAWDEVCDIELLLQATHLMGRFRQRELYGDVDDGEAMAKSLTDDELAGAASYLAKRKVSADERKRLAAAGHALPDGSYPIESEEDLHNAAILARSGHGDTAAAKRLIGKRAKELGVANPLSNDTAKDTEDVTEQTSPAPEAPEGQAEKSAEPDFEALVAKAVEPFQEVIKGLESQMAALKSTPIPGGPAVTSLVPASDGERAQHLAKAAYHDRLAGQVTDRELIRYHEEKAAEARTAANG